MEVQFIVAIATTSAILLALLSLLIRRTVIATPISFTWQRKVWLEHYIWVKENSKDGYPEGCRNRVSTFEQPDRTPVTSTMSLYIAAPRTRITYSYEIRRWCNSRELFAKGDKRTTVSWPSYTLDDTTHERIRKTKEKYLASFQTPNHKKYRCKLPESAWTTLDEQSAYRLRITLYGKVTRIVPATEQH